MPPCSTLRQAQPGEYYCYQLGLFATNRSIADMELELGELRNAQGKTIPASAMTCFSLSGTDWLGKPFTKAFRLDAGLVRPLWIGVQIPKDAAGTYRGRRPASRPPRAMPPGA